MTNNKGMNCILSRKQFEQATSLSRATIERMWRAGKLRRVQLSDRRFGYPVSEVERLSSGRPGEDLDGDGMVQGGNK